MCIFLRHKFVFNINIYKNIYFYDEKILLKVFLRNFKKA